MYKLLIITGIDGVNGPVSIVQNVESFAREEQAENAQKQIQRLQESIDKRKEKIFIKTVLLF